MRTSQMQKEALVLQSVNGSAYRLLSSQEMNVVTHAANGLLDKEIARIIGVQPATIRTYWERLRIKLKARNRTHAVSIAVALGAVSVDLAHLGLGSQAGPSEFEAAE